MNILRNAVVLATCALLGLGALGGTLAATQALDTASTAQVQARGIIWP